MVVGVGIWAGVGAGGGVGVGTSMLEPRSSKLEFRTLNLGGGQQPHNRQP